MALLKSSATSLRSSPVESHIEPTGGMPHTGDVGNQELHRWREAGSSWAKRSFQYAL